MKEKNITELDNYQNEACKTYIADREKIESIKYCMMKLAEEVGEISGMVAKHVYHGKEFDVENYKEELGDILWYVAAAAKQLDMTLSEIASYNITKLRKRHGEKYNEQYYKQD